MLTYINNKEYLENTTGGNTMSPLMKSCFYDLLRIYAGHSLGGQWCVLTLQTTSLR